MSSRSPVIRKFGFLPAALAVVAEGTKQVFLLTADMLIQGLGERTLTELCGVPHCILRLCESRGLAHSRLKAYHKGDSEPAHHHARFELSIILQYLSIHNRLDVNRLPQCIRTVDLQLTLKHTPPLPTAAMLSILRKARLKEKEMRILML